jgi:pilus assembly protein CpaC
VTRYQIRLASAFVLAVAAVGASAAGHRVKPAGPAGVAAPPSVKPCDVVTVDPPMSLALGKSRVLRLAFPALRLIVGGQGRTVAAGRAPAAPAAATSAAAAAAPVMNGSDGVAETDITLLSPTELFLLGRKTGSMNVVVQGADGRCVVKDIVVTIDPGSLQAKLAELMPQETGIRVRGAENALVLTGTVTDAARLDDVLTLARSYADASRVINLLRVTAPQQVMLEVKIAEVSKTLLDRLGLDFARAFTTGDGTAKLISGIVGGAAGLISQSRGDPAAAGPLSATRIGIDAKNRDGIIRILAEPNIMAISGQSASFLSGGKIFIPVAQDRAGAAAAITLEEKEFGVGLRFTPTVLDGRVNLKIVSEVSELSQTGTPFTTVGGTTSVLPSMATRKVDTTVQLGDGQSFAVAGLIRNNMTEALDKFPGLGDAPVLGALFRSTEFQNDQTELMFVVTPHLVKPVSGRVPLPTDNHIVPSRAEVLLQGKGEGRPAAGEPAVVAPVKP